MIVTFRKPVEGLRGKIRLEDFISENCMGNMWRNDAQIGKGHVPTEKERENQQRFADRFAVRS